MCASDSNWIAKSLRLLKSLKAGTLFAVGTSPIKNLEALRSLELLQDQTGGVNIDAIYDEFEKFSNGKWCGLM